MGGRRIFTGGVRFVSEKNFKKGVGVILGLSCVVFSCVYA